MKNKNVVNDLLNYSNLKIVQNQNMFSFSLDSVLLARFINIKLTTKKILDIGTGNAPIPLILTTKTKAKITAVEIQKEVYDLAEESIKINGKENQIELINDDINNYYKTLESDIYDIVICNPPFFKITDNATFNVSDYKKFARHELSLNLEQIIKISKKVLKNNGSLNIVNRPERLIEIINIMSNNNIEPKRIQFVHPKENSEANMVLIEGVKNGKNGLKIMKPIITHEGNGKYTETIKSFFEE